MQRRTSPERLAAADAAAALACLDLTHLATPSTAADIDRVVAAAALAHPCAAVCIPPEHVRDVRARLAPAIAVATVINFPHGTDASERVQRDTRDAVLAGADEIDVVWNVQAFVAGRVDDALAPVHAAARGVCDAARDSVIIKVILETGVLEAAGGAACVHDAATRVVQACEATPAVRFLKTSTGKIAAGATLDAARAMLLAMREATRAAPWGLKVSGGVATLEAATAYMRLAREVMGDDAWVSKATFRIGASRLHAALVARVAQAQRVYPEA